MRSWVRAVLISIGLCGSVFGQTIELKNAKSPSQPSATAMPRSTEAPSEVSAYRPILLGKGPNALINRIDTASLVKGGQKDGLVMFTCSVDKTGKMVVSA